MATFLHNRSAITTNEGDNQWWCRSILMVTTNVDDNRGLWEPMMTTTSSWIYPVLATGKSTLVTTNDVDNFSRLRGLSTLQKPSRPGWAGERSAPAACRGQLEVSQRPHTNVNKKATPKKRNFFPSWWRNLSLKKKEIFFLFCFFLGNCNGATSKNGSNDNDISACITMEGNLIIWIRWKRTSSNLQFQNVAQGDAEYWKFNPYPWLNADPFSCLFFFFLFFFFLFFSFFFSFFFIISFFFSV